MDENAVGYVFPNNYTSAVYDTERRDQDEYQLLRVKTGQLLDKTQIVRGTEPIRFEVTHGATKTIRFVEGNQDIFDTYILSIRELFGLPEKPTVAELEDVAYRTREPALVAWLAAGKLVGGARRRRRQTKAHRRRHSRRIRHTKTHRRNCRR